MKKRVALTLVLCVAVSMLMIFAQSAFAQTTTSPTFVIGIPGRTGCLVCHGDQKLTHDKTKKSLYIDTDELALSAHKDVACTQCHTDFSPIAASQSHQNRSQDFRVAAGLSCKNCHQHAKVLKVYDKSVHGRLALGGTNPKAATCADCHGSHGIRVLKKDKAAKQKFQLSGKQVCGKCHSKYFESYDDYYHGRAYKMQAADAPACWDCHGAHEILPVENSTSKVSKERLAKTCGKCHIDSRDGFARFGKMIHGRQAISKKNFIIKYKDKFMSWLGKTPVGAAYESVVASLF